MGVLLRVLVAAGLAADAYVHWVFASDMAFVDGGSVGGDVLFRVQAVVAALAGILVLVLARRWTYAVAFLVAASAVGALLLYYSVDVGAIGPLPDMYEPVWYGEKTISLVGEGIAALAALAGVLTARRKRAEGTPGPSESASEGPVRQQPL
ncbi:hypothetical protein [Actinomadura rugatobispora]|uniref:Integral membrane protein n=1 Tax=Actinomadura rugatobispora TaxID=1994 RepID=A0ABW1AG27_9ACTN|nr:hypothetical protein GCM10010200_031420 [Actinomadura rugatobispora]